jgi:hypothetical protein
MKFTCSGYRSVTADGLSEAAGIFANRMARRKFGKSGYARTCVQSAICMNGQYAEYGAFIGYTTGRNETTGQNVNFTVSRA